METLVRAVILVTLQFHYISGMINSIPAWELGKRVVAIVWDKPGSGDESWFCMGTPISRRIIVTAASCIRKSVASGLDVLHWDIITSHFRIYLGVFTEDSETYWDDADLRSKIGDYHSIAVKYLKIPVTFRWERYPRGITADIEDGIFKQAFWDDVAFLELYNDAFDEKYLTPPCSDLGMADPEPGDIMIAVGAGERDGGLGSRMAYQTSVTMEYDVKFMDNSGVPNYYVFLAFSLQ